MTSPACARFLAKNKEIFGTRDGLPGEYHRRNLFRQARPGKQAAMVTDHGTVLVGRVVMVFDSHCVLNLGGRYGTPGVMTPEACVYVAGATL
jgi:hypothetical protein